MLSCALFALRRKLHRILMHTHLKRRSCRRSIGGFGITNPFLGQPMPLVRIDLIEGKLPDYRDRLGEVVYKTSSRCLAFLNTIASRSSPNTRRLRCVTHLTILV